MAEGSSNFSERVSSVFGALNSTLKSFTDSPCKQDPDEEPKERQLSRESRDSRHTSSLSRDRSPHRVQRRHHVTQGGGRRPARVPDHVTHPQNWTKYDLSDDGTQNSEYEGLSSDQLNRRAAFEFLQLRSKEEESRDQDTTPTSASSSRCGQLNFKKPRSEKNKDLKLTRKTVDEGGHQNTAHYQSGALRMPEYVVGSKQARDRLSVRKASQPEGEGVERTSSASSVRLSHLGSREEEEEEEGKALAN